MREYLYATVQLLLRPVDFTHLSTGYGEYSFQLLKSNAYDVFLFECVLKVYAFCLKTPPKLKLGDKIKIHDKAYRCANPLCVCCHSAQALRPIQPQRNMIFFPTKN